MNNLKTKDSVLSIKNNICFLKLEDKRKLLDEKDNVNKIINLNTNILCFTLILSSDNNNFNLSQTVKKEIYKWITEINIITVIVVDDCYIGDLLEIGMMFDIRLGGKDIKITFPKNTSNYGFNFFDRCNLVMGNRIKQHNYYELLGNTLNSKCKYFYNFINKVIKSENYVDEVSAYIGGLLKNKDEFQIRSIISCFKYYSKLGLNVERAKLIKEEKKQFHILVARGKR